DHSSEPEFSARSETALRLCCTLPALFLLRLIGDDAVAEAPLSQRLRAVPTPPHLSRRVGLPPLAFRLFSRGPCSMPPLLFLRRVGSMPRSQQQIHFSSRLQRLRQSSSRPLQLRLSSHLQQLQLSFTYPPKKLSKVLLQFVFRLMPWSS
ncbi:hypothetical protein GOODEAATRI_033258, partial [Goodea atripinnis]